jgi:type 1 glutamine amidotransferase
MRTMKKLLLTLAASAVVLTSSAADKKIVFIAGPPSHGPGAHEHRAGSLLFKACLDQVPGVTSVVYSNGWPNEAGAFDGAAAIVVYSDGGAGHPLLKEDHLKTISALMDKGVGLACIHYAVEPTIEKGQKEFLDWIGGAFEINWSVNPDWTADFKSFPDHPIARGVQPFKIEDEWYFHMRFRDGMKGITPVLTAVPTESTTKRNDGPHEGNPAMREAVARGDLQTMAWASERPDGGRGFAFTGGHFHKNWGDENFRKVVLNGILWIAKIEVPKDGVKSTVTPEELKANPDLKPGRR